VAAPVADGVVGSDAEPVLIAIGHDLLDIGPQTAWPLYRASERVRPARARALRRAVTSVLAWPDDL